jgi:hypothetical protein
MRGGEGVVLCAVKDSVADVPGIVGQRHEPRVSGHHEHPRSGQINDLPGLNLIKRARHDLTRRLLVAWPEEEDHGCHQDHTQQGKSHREPSHSRKLANGPTRAEVPVCAIWRPSDQGRRIVVVLEAGDADRRSSLLDASSFLGGGHNCQTAE